RLLFVPLIPQDEGRTGSLLSVYSDAGDFGNVTVQGSVEFALMYSPLGELVIMVEQCQDLAIANPRKQRTDPSFSCVKQLGGNTLPESCGRGKGLKNHRLQKSQIIGNMHQ
uniref:Uncharacterized protein n=1 Tax=Astyanax mexicanus TaxID=7994 RepID=A0A3B1JBA9_ASTMX